MCFNKENSSKNGKDEALLHVRVQKIEDEEELLKSIIKQYKERQDLCLRILDGLHEMREEKGSNE